MTYKNKNNATLRVNNIHRTCIPFNCNNEKDIGGLEKWKWTLGGIMIALTFLMTVFSTFWAVHT